MTCVFKANLLVLNFVKINNMEGNLAIMHYKRVVWLLRMQILVHSSQTCIVSLKICTIQIVFD